MVAGEEALSAETDPQLMNESFRAVYSREGGFYALREDGDLWT